MVNIKNKINMALPKINKSKINLITVPIEPIYKNLFNCIVKDTKGDKQDVISSQVYSVVFPSNSSLLELKINLNQGLITSIISEGMSAKTIKLEFHARDGKIQFEMEYNVNYRNYEGIDGDYNNTDVMELTLYYQIVDVYLTEEVNGVIKKVRLK